MNKEQCNHNPIRSDLGFILCRNCDEILDTPTISDLAYAEMKGQLKIGDYS